MARYKNNTGVKVCDILLPAQSVDLSKWAVVACDQYTSQPEYWEETARIVGDAPSTLKVILPELYLDKPGEEERIQDIRRTMDEYLDNGVLVSKGEGFVLVRRTCMGKTRQGLVLALDMEAYDYSKSSTALIRASEGTVVERIPPRLRIRWGAPIELPHILVLIDDPARSVIEPLAAQMSRLEQVYNVDLMQGGGHVDGYFVQEETMIQGVLDALEALKQSFSAKYGDRPPLLFAMGDGNHSLATAKANWEKLKQTLSPAQQEDHPARYALVEIENIHDEGIVFEPIHRVVFGMGGTCGVEYLTAKLAEQNGGCGWVDCASREDMERQAAKEPSGAHILPAMFQQGWGYFRVTNPAAQMEAGTLQNAIDAMLEDVKGASVDYIHGDAVTVDLGRKPGNMGFLLPPMAKSAFFDTVVYDGALPRKTFSMGEAQEKRYYMECRRIL